jgi:hypothetical protein
MATQLFHSDDDHYLLGIFSRASPGCFVSRLCLHAGERASLMRIPPVHTVMYRLPIPDAPDAEQGDWGARANDHRHGA